MSETSDVTSGDTCQELVESVTAYMEGAMGEAERAVFEAHVAACPPCAVYLAQIQVTITEAGHLPREGLPRELCDDLVRAFRDWHRGELNA